MCRERMGCKYKLSRSRLWHPRGGRLTIYVVSFTEEITFIPNRRSDASSPVRRTYQLCSELSFPPPPPHLERCINKCHHTLHYFLFLFRTLPEAAGYDTRREAFTYCERALEQVVSLLWL